MSTNPPNVRYPFTTDPDQFPEGQEHDKNWRKQVHAAIKNAYNGLLDLNQAIPVILSKITAPTNPSVATSTAGNTIGTVNNQAGQSSYVLQQSDYGALVVVSHSGSVAVSLNNGITKPYYTRVKVDSGSGTTIITAPPGTTINGAGFISVAAGTTVQINANSSDLNYTAS